jgi:serine/threonine-protein kinase
VRETFGRYQIIGMMGEGGMGRLYIAERRGIQGFVKIVALKRILPHLANSAHLREMFLNEGRIAAKLEHPNIVATYELGEVDGQYFISMEYLPGEDLSAIIARCPGSHRIPIEIATALAQQAAQGLHYAHEARDATGQPIGLVHRDVNPRNVFLTYHGVVKLLDFGVVKDRDSLNTLPGAFKGKYGYCAPEQIEGRRLDRRTDIFCLGIVLWECLTGARLFDASTNVTAIDAVRSRRLEPPSVLRPEIPRVLDQIVLRALERDPARRFQSAHDLSEELDAFLLERDSRPTPKSMGRWLESIFSTERATLKKAISQGGAVEETLARLAVLDAARPTAGGRTGSSRGGSQARARTLWSTSFGATEDGSGRADSGRSTLPSTARFSTLAIPTFLVSEGSTGATSGAPPANFSGPLLPGAPGRLRVAGIAAGALVLAAVILLMAAGGSPRDPAGASSASSPTSAASAAAKLEVQSRPPGAQVFVDGSPSGLKTPAVLSGLPVGRVVSIRLDFPGYQPATEQARLESGQTGRLTIALRQAVGTVRLVGVGKHVSAFLDDRPVDPDKPFSAGAGPHKVRVEAGGSVLLSRAIDVQAGSETLLEVDQQRSRP